MWEASAVAVAALSVVLMAARLVAARSLRLLMVMVMMVVLCRLRRLMLVLMAMQAVLMRQHCMAHDVGLSAARTAHVLRLAAVSRTVPTMMVPHVMVELRAAVRAMLVLRALQVLLGCWWCNMAVLRMAR